MIGCLLDPIGCIGSAMWAWVASVEWYWWALGGLIIVGAVWKLAGTPGLIALAAGVGFILGRRSADDPVEVEDGPPVRRRSSQKPPPGKRVRTIFDMFGKK